MKNRALVCERDTCTHVQTHHSYTNYFKCKKGFLFFHYHHHHRYHRTELISMKIVCFRPESDFRCRQVVNPLSINQSINQTINQSLARSLTHSLNHSLTQSINHPPTHPLTHSTPLNHSPNHLLTEPLTHSINHPPTNQPKLSAVRGRHSPIDMRPQIPHAP